MGFEIVFKSQSGDECVAKALRAVPAQLGDASGTISPPSQISEVLLRWTAIPALDALTAPLCGEGGLATEVDTPPGENELPINIQGPKELQLIYSVELKSKRSQEVNDLT